MKEPTPIPGDAPKEEPKEAPREAAPETAKETPRERPGLFGKAVPRAAEPSRPEPSKVEKPKSEVKVESARPARPRKLPSDTFHLFAILVQAIAWLGVIIIVYGAISTVTNEFWPPLERFIVPIAATLVLLATILNALTAYLPPETSAVSSSGRYIAGPAIIILCAAALFAVWYRGLPVSVVLGLAVLGLAWALGRALPRRTPDW